MAFFDYAKTAETARKLLNKFGHGTRVKIEREVGGGQDPVTGIVTPGTKETHFVSGVLVNYDLKEIDGTRIQANDRKLIIDGTVEPLMTDIIMIGDEYLGVIINIAPTKPADKAVIYELQVRV